MSATPNRSRSSASDAATRTSGAGRVLRDRARSAQYGPRGAAPPCRARVRHRSFLRPAAPHPGQDLSKKGGFLEHPELFDPDAFGIAPRRADDGAQQRLMIEVTWDALDDAGIPIESVAGERRRDPRLHGRGLFPRDAPASSARPPSTGATTSSPSAACPTPSSRAASPSCSG
ncbi:MAG: hypothetical protein IPK00_24675 [Deltaproteobacteria bacterium]|nr:hypothetical protein [Deltaproteobacteria bacterium]